VADARSTAENATINFDVRSNDSDPDGPAGPFAVAQIGGNAVVAGGFVILASGAKVTLQADGTLTYDPNGKFDYLVDSAAAAGAVNTYATDSFTYTLAGGG
jgi:hypothetical protein